LGELLRRCRVAAGLTQEELAEQAGLSARGLSDLERGVHRAPHQDTLQRLAQALRMNEVDRAKLLAAARHQVPHQRASSFVPAIELPRALTVFVGRDHELKELRRLAGTCRLLTLTGTGGVGKTRLAIEVARDIPGRVVFVDLAILADSTLVAQTIASILGVRDQSQQPILQTLANALQSARLLVLMDNCEHLIAGCAELADTLLRGCPHLRILTTSREPLGIDGEAVWPVPPLSLPSFNGPQALEQIADSEAVRLFTERARSVLPTFAVTEHTAAAVADVCIKLDGIPLAIELAAARVRALGVDQIATRLNNRFGLLATGRRAALPRHQTLRAAIDWSYELLSTAEQRLFQRLAVFAGGWTLEAAETVCAGHGIEAGEVLDVLSRLVDKSLVLAEPGTGGTVRYCFLETIRQYAVERLQQAGDSELHYKLHRDWCEAIGEQALNDYWWGVNLLGWLERLKYEQANFRAALGFSLERGEAEQGLRLAAGIWVLWARRGSWAEGRDWIARLLTLCGAADYPAARADALSAAGQMAFQQGDYISAQMLLAEAVALQRKVGNPRGLAMAVTHAGLPARGRGQYEAARLLHEEGMLLSRAAGNRGYEAVCLSALAHAVYLQGEYELARSFAEQALVLLSAGHRGGRASVDATIPLYVLGRVGLCTGNYGAARQFFEETLALWRTTGDARSAPQALAGLGCVSLMDGDPALARILLEEALSLSEELGSSVGLVYALEGFAALAAAESTSEVALRLAGAAGALRATLDHPISTPEHTVLKRWLEPARRSLGEHATALAWAAGEALSAEQAVACARALPPDRSRR